MQTAWFLSTFANIAHMDITCNNVMALDEHDGAWGNLKLLDFGYAQVCNPGEQVCTQECDSLYC